MVISIAERDGRLFAQPPGGSMDPLRPVSETEFKMTSADVTLSFVPSGEGKIEVLKVKHGDQTDNAVRVKPFDKASVKLAEFTGKCYSDELATEYQFAEVGKKLTMKHSRVSDIELTPVKKDKEFSNNWLKNVKLRDKE